MPGQEHERAVLTLGDGEQGVELGGAVGGALLPRRRRVGRHAHPVEGVDVGSPGPAQRPVEGARGRQADLHRGWLKPLRFKLAQPERRGVTRRPQQVLSAPSRDEGLDAVTVILARVRRHEGTGAAVQRRPDLGQPPERGRVVRHAGLHRAAPALTGRQLFPRLGLLDGVSPSVRDERAIRADHASTLVLIVNAKSASCVTWAFSFCKMPSQMMSTAC